MEIFLLITLLVIIALWTFAIALVLKSNSQSDNRIGWIFFHLIVVTIVWGLAVISNIQVTQ